RSDELQQGFGVVGGDAGVGQRRAQGARMRGLRQVAVESDAQALFFQTLKAAGEGGAASLSEQAVQTVLPACIQPCLVLLRSAHQAPSPTCRFAAARPSMPDYRQKDHWGLLPCRDKAATGLCCGGA